MLILESNYMLSIVIFSKEDTLYLIYFVSNEATLWLNLSVCVSFFFFMGGNVMFYDRELIVFWRFPLPTGIQFVITFVSR